MLFVNNLDPFSSVIVMTFRRDESLSVPELELLVELPIAFDFCISCCFIIIMITVCLVVGKNSLGTKVTPHSHWGSMVKIKIFSGYWGD